jgi:hypothetical protein
MKIKLKQGVKPFRIVFGDKEWKIPKIDKIPKELYAQIKNKVSEVKPKETQDAQIRK